MARKHLSKFAGKKGVELSVATPDTRDPALILPAAPSTPGPETRWRISQCLAVSTRIIPTGTRSAPRGMCFQTDLPAVRSAGMRARDHLPRIRRLNLPGARIYDLRHLNITYTIAAGVDPRTVADRAGHKDPGYLIRRYAHAVAAAQDRATDVASNLLAKPAGLAR